MVTPHEQRATQQRDHKVAAVKGFAPQARRTSLLALQMITDIRRDSRLTDGPVDAKFGSRGILR